MAKNTSKKVNKEDLPKFDISGMEIKNVRKIAKNVITFSLSGNGLGLYGLKIVKGEKGNFVAPPSQKGKDGNYYPIFNVYLSEKDEKQLMKEVVTIYNDAEDEDDDDDDDEDGDDLPF